MKDQQIGVREIMTSGNRYGVWYGVAAIWGFFAFIRMAIYQLDKLLIAWAVGFGVMMVAYFVYAVVHIRRYGKQPSKDEEQSAIRTIGGSVFSVIWSAFVMGSIFSVVVVVEYNDPFTKEAVDRVCTEHVAVFWSVVAAGAVIGAIDRIQRIIRSRAQDSPQNES